MKDREEIIPGEVPYGYDLTCAARKKIAAAQRAQWAKVRAQQAEKKVA